MKSNIIDKILDTTKSLYVNYKVLPIQIAKQKPIYMSWRVKCKGLYKGCIEINSDKIYKGMIQLGFNRVSPGMRGNLKSYINIIDNGKIIFGGKADLSRGISLNVSKNAVLKIGSGIYTNANCFIQCMHKVEIGKDNMWGWNIEILDGDGHPIYDNAHNIINHNKGIHIGDNVWLGAHSKVLKGSTIQEGCVIGYGTIVSGKNGNANAVLVGNPPREVKHDISWDRGELLSNQEYQEKDML